MSSHPFAANLETLPQTLAVFPLSGALLLPHQQLPLNIFEPRYLSMVLDALGEGRHIGMIQPDPAQPDTDPPAIYGVGCAGRITTFQESGDGRLFINLTGVCRFDVVEELEMRHGYRRVRAHWSRFALDLSEPEPTAVRSELLESSLRSYLDSNGMKADWDELRKVDTDTLVSLLSMRLPFTTEEKQALLEADTGTDRASMLMANLDMGGPGADTPRGTVH